MNARSPKSGKKILPVLHSVTFSAELAAGLLRYRSLEFPPLSRCGRAVLRASLSLWLENSSEKTIPVTWLRPFSNSSRSADLNGYMVNRLQQQLASTGSTLYSLSWKNKVTPAGRQYCQRQASVPRTNAIAFSLVHSWPTPVANPANGSPEAFKQRKLNSIARGSQMGSTVSDIQMVAKLAAWPTPTTRDHKDGAECLNVPTNSLLGRQVWQANWPTPRSADGEKNVRTLDGALTEISRKGAPQDVAQAAAIAGPIRITASGQILTGSDAGMESSGQLNPAHSRWLMGFPPEWDDCAVTAMPSSRKSQQNLSSVSKEQSPTRKKKPLPKINS